MMTVRDLKTRLVMGEYGDDTHVCIALPQGVPSGKYELVGSWMDAHGVLNLIVGPAADDLDPNLKRENDLE